MAQSAQDVQAKTGALEQQVQKYLQEQKPQLAIPLLLEVASGQLPKALSVAVKLEDLAPQDPQVLLAIHQISRQTMYQSLLSMMMVAPDSAQIHMVMAGELARQGDRTSAIAQYREAIR